MTHNKPDSTKQTKSGSIRQRLLRSYITVALIPTLIIAIVSTFFVQLNLHQKANDNLFALIQQKESDINNFYDALFFQMNTFVQENYALEWIRNSLNLSNIEREYQYYLEATKLRIKRLADGSDLFENINLFNIQGEKVVSSHDEISTLEQLPLDTILSSLEKKQIFFLDIDDENYEIYCLFPVSDFTGEIIGVLVGQVNRQAFQSLLTNESESYEYHLSYLSVNSSILESSPFSNGQTGLAVYRDREGNFVYGAAKLFEDVNQILLIEQPILNAYKDFLMVISINIIIFISGIVFAVISASVTSNAIASPIIDLAAVAKRISLGNLKLRATENQQDEIGVLARSFNQMTNQLSELVQNLEEKVFARTKTLAERAKLMEINFQVSKEITAILDKDNLLKQIVRIMDQSFSFSELRLYLLHDEPEGFDIHDKNGIENTTMETVFKQNPEIEKAWKEGKPVLDKQLIENSIASTETERQLPQQLILPLWVGSKIIGLLEIHNMEDDLLYEDIRLIQILASQIAISIENAQLYDQSKQIATLEERNRIARDLHDSVIQSLYSLGLMLEGWHQNICDGKTENLEQNILRIIEVNQKALKEMRMIIYELRPVDLENNGLINTLRQRFNMLEKRSGIDIQFNVGEINRFSADIEQCLYRIINEALNNTLKHSQADNVSISIQKDNTYWKIEIIDNGIGFDLEKALESGGMGLNNMMERASEIEAELKIESNPGKGTKIRIQLINAV